MKQQMPIGAGGVTLYNHPHKKGLKEYLDTEEKYSPPFLRIGMAAVWLWFGINQLLYPKDFLQWMPKAGIVTHFNPTHVVYLNGVFETLLGLLLLIGLFTRLASLVLAIHLAGIVVFAVGYNAIAIRNFGLIIANFVIFLDGHDQWTVDNLLVNRTTSQSRLGALLRKLLL